MYLSNSERTIFLKCHGYKLAIVRAAEKSAKLHNIFAAKAMLSTLKARYHRLSVQLQVNKSSIQNKQTSTFTVRDFTKETLGKSCKYLLVTTSVVFCVISLEPIKI